MAKPETPLLSRDEGLIIKALCIIIVMLHNYLHLRGFAAENEFQFYQERADAMWQMLLHPNLDLPLHFASHAVTYALVGFLFVSGYGLVKRYEQPSSSFERWSFIGLHYTKLVRLVFLPMILAFVAFWLTHDYWPLTWRDRLTELLLLGNLHYNHISIYPFVYWYLGLAMQLYLLYALLLHRRQSYPWWHQLLLLTLVVVCGAVQMCCKPTGYPIYFLRVNMVGYVGPFVTGIVAARHLDHISLKSWQWWLVVLMSGTLMVYSLWQFYSWLWGWLPATVLAVSFVKANRWLRWRPIIWLGGISAMVYVIHPIVRELVIGFTHHHIRLELLVYLVVSVLFAAGYAWLLRHIKVFS